MLRRVSLALFLALALPVAVFADGKVEAIGPLADGGVSESVKKLLEQKGYRVTLDDGTVAAEIYLRANLPAGKTDTAGAVYTGLSHSVIVGVVTFPKQTQDFRGQMVKAGTYTMRYSQHPVDGNHLGISQIRDFLLLIPASEDQKAEAEYKFEELVKLSAKTTGSNHPASLSLAMPEDRGAAPTVALNDHGHVVFFAKLKTASGEMPIAFVVKGIAEQ
jgi:hypothetical protein